jgi:hypothetical protein
MISLIRSTIKIQCKRRKRKIKDLQINEENKLSNKIGMKTMFIYFFFISFRQLYLLFYYSLLILLFFMNQLSIENVLFSLLYMISRPHDFLLIFII